jgi:hypothetical protein
VKGRRRFLKKGRERGFLNKGGVFKIPGNKIPGN